MKSLFAVLLALAAFSARAQAPDLCRVTEDLADFSAAWNTDEGADAAGTEDDTVRVSADHAEIARDGNSVVRGNVQVEQGRRLLRADRAIYDQDEETLSVAGHVQYRDPEVRVRGEEALFDGPAEHIEFSGTEFELPRRPARGAAGSLILSGDETLRMEDVSYTTCPPGNDDWQLLASRIRLDHESGTGTARDVRIDFKGVPILYTPWLSFPFTDARKSGFLVPEFGRSSRSGTDLRVPWYWNIAPNLDATITPRLLSQRGLQMNGKLRYLTAGSRGGFEFEYLPDDHLADESRGFASLDHETLFPGGLRFIADLQDASDDQYFEDLGRSLSETSVTHLPRDIILDYRYAGWLLRARAQNYRTIDTSIAPLDRPYTRVPQILAGGRWPRSALGLDYGFGSELVNFERDDGVTGSRLDLAPRAELPLGGAGWFVTSAVELGHTRYWLDDTAAGADTSLSRTLPRYSLDSGMIFERMTGRDGRYVQTLEPRILYVHIPFTEQDDLPVFDTGLPEFNLVQLYRDNRFIGPDRIGDTDKLSAGVTSRLIGAADGNQYLSATLGQAYFLSEQSVRLPDEPQLDRNASNYIAELDVGIYEGFNLDFGYQWDPATDRTAQAETRLNYHGEDGRIANVAYRFRRGVVEQTDLSFAWPVATRWRLLGRLNYSLLDDTTLERLVGFEYEACCWALRVVSRRHISRRTGESDTAVAVQIELKGLANVGDSADRLLERGILGYSTDYD
ncbi:MAG TPA: LPS assembly protein LptD [Gammaproteobacteria bacterium]|nr:LPS assembly protein LptD [Gammaproteobacteria bacterium]